MVSETIELPWPPSVNATYRTFSFISKKTGKPASRPILSVEGRGYFNSVRKILRKRVFINFENARLKVEVTCFPKDRRIRDLGNLDKVLMDALQKVGVFRNDAQIDELRFIRGRVCLNKNARVVVRLEEIVPFSGPDCDCVLCEETEPPKLV